MTNHVQPDLFGDYDRQQEASARRRQPATCPCCGTREPNGYLLLQNHGIDVDDLGIGGFPPGQHPIYGGACVAQHLVRNHIIHAAQTGAVAQLKERMRRGRDLGLDVDSIIHEAHADRDTTSRHA